MYTTRIFMIVHVQCEKDNGEILGNTFMASIGYRIKNIFYGLFLGWTHEGKTRFLILPRCCTLPPPREKQYAFQSGRVFLSLDTYLSMPFYLEMRGSNHLGYLDACWPHPNGETKATSWEISGIFQV